MKQCYNYQLFWNHTKSNKVKSLNKSILLVLKPYSEYILISPIAILEASKNIKYVQIYFFNCSKVIVTSYPLLAGFRIMQVKKK